MTALAAAVDGVRFTADVVVGLGRRQSLQLGCAMRQGFATGTLVLWKSIEDIRHLPQWSSKTQTKMNYPVAGWAVLVTYILYVFSWTDMSCDNGDHGLIWIREQANIKLGVNDSISLYDIYLNSCERYLQDRGAIYTLRSVELSDEICKACSSRSRGRVFDSGSPRWTVAFARRFRWKRRSLWKYTFKDAFMQDCMVNGISAEVAPEQGLVPSSIPRRVVDLVQHPLAWSRTFRSLGI